MAHSPARLPVFFLGASVLVVGACVVGACASDESNSTSDAGSDGPSSSSSSSSSSSTSSTSSGGDSTPGTFTVGGQVTGLFVPTAVDGGAPDAGDAGDAGTAPTSLTLQNNGGDNLVVSKDGPFAFSKALASGATYDVKVSTQPTGHACTVAKGSGKGTSNVTDVAVTCARDTFTVTANVTGLAATGLVLQNNAANDLAVVAPGPTPFTTKVQWGAPYDVTVKTQPTSRPKQTCAITGTAKGNAFGNVTVDVDCTLDFLSATSIVADITGATDVDPGGVAVALAWDGTNYYQGVATTATNQFVKLGPNLAFVSGSAFSPSRDIRDMFAVGTQLWIRTSGGSLAIEKVSNTGVVTAGVTLASGVARTDQPVVYEVKGNRFVSLDDAGVLRRWSAADGTDQPSVTLVGFGTVVGENTIWNSNWIAAGGGYVFTMVGSQLSAWDPVTGVRTKTVTLTGANADPATQNIVTLSYTNNHLFLRDAYAGSSTWRGWDLGL